MFIVTVDVPIQWHRHFVLLSVTLCPQSAVGGSAEPIPCGGRLENVQLGLSGQHDEAGKWSQSTEA